MLRKKLKKKLLEIKGIWSPVQQSGMPIVTDPNGSYTGRGTDPYEVPVQDVDDL